MPRGAREGVHRVAQAGARCLNRRHEAEDQGESVDNGEAIEPTKQEASREKVIVRSNGVVTYVGKDIANQFWKFGLLGKDFYYRVYETRDGRP